MPAESSEQMQRPARLSMLAALLTGQGTIRLCPVPGDAESA